MRQIKDSVVLVTGGTGSFGNRIAGFLPQLGPAEVRIFSRDEAKQWEMRERYPRFRFIVGDVRDPQRIREAMRGVDYVFHAAALKQVPSCEEYPLEAIKTNVLGSQNACQAAIDCGVTTFVALSTDKAVKPINAMGISKGMMEKLVCSQNRWQSRTTFCCVRYGNVMGTRGSVIPYFRTLIDRNLPLGITAPEMTRFLMTLDQSVDLVLRAMTGAEGGEIFVRKAPACTVWALAEAMIEEYSPRGLRHPIEITGVRPGEKLHETLVSEYEMQRCSENETYFVIYPEYRRGETTTQPLGLEYTSENTTQLRASAEIRALLAAMGKQVALV